MSGKDWDSTNLKIEARGVGRTKIRPEKELIFESARLTGEDFSDRKLDSLGAINSRFESCRFDGLRVTKYSACLGGGASQSLYQDCSFDGARMSLTGGNARFVRCSFKEVDLRDWFCFEVELIDCVFTGRLRGVVFNGTPHLDKVGKLGRKGNEFRGNDFSEAELVDVAFRTGIDLSQQRLPSGPDYLYLPNAAKTLRRAREEVMMWTDLNLRRGVLKSLKSHEWELRGGQNQLLLRPKDYWTYSALRRERPALEAMFRLLERFS